MLYFLSLLKIIWFSKQKDFSIFWKFEILKIKNVIFCEILKSISKNRTNFVLLIFDVLENLIDFILSSRGIFEIQDV